MEIIFQNKTQKSIAPKKLAEIAKAVIQAELGERKIGTINVLLTDDAEITSINERFRNHRESTDVLSFGYGLEEETVGDIAISLERIEEQSREFNNTFEEELAYILIHAILHLLGYDHSGYDTGPEEIFALQKEYFQRFYREG